MTATGYTEPAAKAPEDFTLKSVEWYADRNVLDVRCQHIDFTIEEDDQFWMDILPQGEYKYCDENSGLIPARMDNYFNMHWLVLNFKGLVEHKVVHLKPILEDIARRKFNHWK